MPRIHETIETMTKQAVMPAPNYSVVRNCLAQLAPFKHQKIRARFETIDGEPTYVVRSYRTPVAWVTRDAVTITDDQYGTTTSKHKVYVRAHAVPLSERVR